MAEEFASIKIDPGDWYQVRQDLLRFEPALARALSRSMRNIGKPVVERVKDTLRLPAPSDGPDSGKGRAALIAATRFAVSFSRSGAGVRIVTSASRLPAENKGLLNVYNKKSFRHPVFGDTNNWVAQEGRPYFRKSIYGALEDGVVVRELGNAIDEATKVIGARSI